MIEHYHCPRCSVELERSGVVTMGEFSLPVFQCDRCTVPLQLGHETIWVAYTFAVDRMGRPIDAEPEPFS